jgi:hypothetical protein
MSRLFETIRDESRDSDLEVVDEIVASYDSGEISRERCVKKLIGAWGEAGYSVSPDNAGAYLDIVSGQDRSKLFEETIKAYRGQSGSDPDYDYFSKPRKNRHNDSKQMIGKWYTDNPDVAATYGKIQYEAELDPKDPLVVDAEGNYWDEFAVPASEDDPKAYVMESPSTGARKTVKNTDTNKIAKEAKRDGHDAVIIENVIDLGHSYGNDRSHEPSTDIAVFDPEAIKDERLFEKVLFRGYRNDALNIDSGMKPNDGGDLLYTTPNADHAFMFAEGQTTAGSERVFEVYDVPDDVRLYDAEADPLDLITPAAVDDDQRRYPEVWRLKGADEESKALIDTLKAEGYEGFKAHDTIAFEGDIDDYPGQYRTRSYQEEDVLFSKPDPVDVIKTNNSGEFSEKALSKLSALGVHVYEDDDDGYEMSEEEAAHWREVEEDDRITRDMDDDELADYLEEKRNPTWKRKTPKLFDDQYLDD